MSVSTVQNNPAASATYNALNVSAMRPAGQVEWIQGFGDCSRAPTMKVLLSPVVRCLDRATKANPRLSTSGIRRCDDSLITREFAISGLPKAIPGTACFLDARSFVGVPIDKTKFAPVRHSLRTLEVNVRDESSDVVLTGRVNTPAIVSNLIRSITPREPSDVALLLIDDGERLVVLSCSEILRFCYSASPHRFAAYMKGLPGATAAYECDNVIFNGFTYAPIEQTKRWYPMKAHRYRARAEYEMSQLMPRAMAYALAHNGEMPFIIRFPFMGRALLSGDMLTRYIESREVTFILRLTNIQPAFDANYDVDEPRRRTQFWPLQSNVTGIELPALTALSRGSNVLSRMRRSLQLLQSAV